MEAMSELTAKVLDWERRLGDTLSLFGHRNWIVVADAAYPAQSNAGIETICMGADQIHVLRRVTDAIAAARHIRANIYLDCDLQFVSESDAPGVASYRRELELLMANAVVNRLPHEQIIAKLDQSAQVFRVLILKTELTIPYTSVFFELDCGYWSREAEKRLREAMAQSSQS
jgi:L-fucose mutarotase/ribose pyranase (RbsD/FucU family)